jgi:sulfide:quinone oxidoreductase
VVAPTGSHAEIDYPLDPGQYPARSRIKGVPRGETREMDIRKITEELSVAPQIRADDISAIAAAGFRAVICNRPDGESSDQPCCEDIEAAVKASGLEWRMQPVRSGGVTQADAAAFGVLMTELPKPVLAYCRSGTRCATLWCLSEAGKRPLPDILERARSAGYDMAAIMESALGPST